MQVQQRNAGLGSKLLNSVLDWADSNGKTLVLIPAAEPDAALGGLNQEQLKAWYARNNFEDRVDYMVRKPQQAKETPSVITPTETKQAKEEGAAKTTERTEVAESATNELTDEEQSIIQAELDEQQSQSEVSKVKKARGKRRQKEAEATEKGEPPPAKEKKVKKAKAEKAAEPSKPVPDDAGETAYKKYMALSLANRKRVAKEFGLTVEQVADRELYFTDPAGMEEVIALVQRRAEGKGNVEFEQLGMVNPIVPFNVEDYRDWETDRKSVV